MIVYYLKTLVLIKKNITTIQNKQEKNGFDGTGGRERERERERASQRFNTIAFIAEKLAKGRIKT